MRLFDHLETMLGRVMQSREPEIVLLNGHLLVERTLVAAVSARLGCMEDEVPRFAFRTFVQLAFRREEDAKPLLVFNELRNALAHQFDALDSDRFRELMLQLGLAWPQGTLERAVAIQVVIYDAIRRVLTRMLEELEEPELPPSDEEDEDYQELKGWVTTISEAAEHTRDLAERGEWDFLINVMKPGWRKGR